MSRLTRGANAMTTRCRARPDRSPADTRLAGRDAVTGDWLRIGGDGRPRCWWPGDDPLYVDYHDSEWARPVTDDVRLFEKICLEGFQAGLAWITILRKRENFRVAFAGFDPRVVARFGPGDVERLLGDVGIVRHRGKIEAAIGNAARVLEVIEEHGSLSRHVWSFAPDAAGGRDGESSHPSGIASVSPSATALSRDLKRRGFRFVGPTTVHAFMQSMGLVNEHLPGCHVHEECESERATVLARVRSAG